MIIYINIGIAIATIIAYLFIQAKYKLPKYRDPIFFIIIFAPSFIVSFLPFDKSLISYCYTFTSIAFMTDTIFYYFMKRSVKKIVEEEEKKKEIQQKNKLSAEKEKERKEKRNKNNMKI